MSPNPPGFGTTVGQKLLLALTGLLLFAFLIGHLLGNLLLFLEDPSPFNRYADTLVNLGWPLILVEIFLLAAFIAHIAAAVSVTWRNRKARPIGYQKFKSAGEPSQKSLASSTMIWTGLVLLVFTVLHIYTFKYGPGVEEGYVSEIDGQRIRDLHRLVMEVFRDPLYVCWYVGAMIFLGFHLRHGFWSAFQSLGLQHPRYTPLIFTVGYISAVILGLGFLGIPLWVYLQEVY